MRNLFLFLLMTLAISSCKKEEVDERTSIIRGKVIECGTQKRLSGVFINLDIVNVDFWPGFHHDSAKSIADNNGNFIINYRPIDKKSDYAYHFELKKDRYIAEEFNFYDNIYANDTTIDFTLEPEAYINLQVENISPAEEGDIIRIHYSVEGIGRMAEYYGANIDTNYMIRTGGNRYQNFAITLYKNSRLERHYTDSIFCPGFDTVNFEIKY